MFGILRPCRHSMPQDLASAWMSHLCGLCLALRDDYGQLARTATNYDGLVISALVAAQSAPGTSTRTAGPCPLRGMRRAEVAEGGGARLAAAVSLMLASGKITDHIDDGDGGYGRWPVRGAARRVADRWSRRANRSGEALAFDSGPLLAVADRQREVERSAAELREATLPTEDATGQAFAHTAALAECPDNAEPLREAGRLFGRIAHLLDAVEDLAEDTERGAWNPILATGAGIEEVRRRCDDAVLGVGLALDEARFTDDRLVRALLGRELERAVRRTFAQAGYPPPGPPPHGHGPHPGGNPPYGPGLYHGGPPPHGPGGMPPGGDGGGYHGGHHGLADNQGSWCCTTPKRHEPPKPRSVLGGCVAMVFMCCTCQQCCREPYPAPWSDRPRASWDCGDCCPNTGGCRCGGGGRSGGGSDGGCDCCDCDCC